MSKQDIEKRLGFAAQGVKAEMASGWSGKTAKLNRYGNFAVVAAGEDGYAKGFANRTQAQAFSDKHNLGGVKFPSSGGRSFYVFVEAPKDSESTSAARPGAKAEFDLTGMELYSRIVPTINSLGRFVEVQAPRLKQNIADAAKYAKKAFDLGQQIFQSNTASPEALRAFERQVSVAKAQPGWRIASSENFSRPGVKAKFEKEYVLWGLPKGETDAIHQQVLSTQAKTPAQMEDVKKRAAAAGWHSFRVQILDLSKPYKGFARPGAKAKMAASDIIVKKDAQYIYYYPEDDDRATFADDNGKGAYTVKSNRTGKPVSAKTYRSLQEAVSASNAMNEKLPPLKKAKASRPGVKAKMETPMRVALTPMHTRAEQGYENFIAVLMKFGGITREQAQKAFKAFKDAKVLVTKEQYMGGGITVKHGAFMERDVIRRAAGLPEESSRPGSKAKA